MNLSAQWSKSSDLLRARFALSPDRLRLLASLTFNLVAKVPGLAAAFIILPMISRSLGTSAYGEFLSAYALGSAFCLPFGGVNTVSRRLLAAAFGARDRQRQANVFVTAVALTVAVALVALAALIVGTARSWSQPVFLLIATFPLLVGILNGFDNLRASYNEHYVTAVLQLVFQILVYVPVYFIGLPAGGVVIAGLSLSSAYALSSVVTLILLAAKRPFLLSGRINNVREMLFPSLGVMMADGALAVLLNLSIYWLQVAHQADMAAWFGTFVRLFQSFASPVLLIIFPITTFISMRWGQLNAGRQRLMHKVFLLIGFGYGGVVGCAMAFAGPLYINHMFKLGMHGDRVDVLALSVFMGAVIAQKSYTLLLYAVSEARFVSFGTAVVSALGVCVAAISYRWLPAVRVTDVLFFAVGVGIPIVLIAGDFRYRRALR